MNINYGSCLTRQEFSLFIDISYLNRYERIFLKFVIYVSEFVPAHETTSSLML